MASWRRYMQLHAVAACHCLTKMSPLGGKRCLQCPEKTKHVVLSTAQLLTCLTCLPSFAKSWAS